MRIGRGLVFALLASVAVVHPGCSGCSSTTDNGDGGTADAWNTDAYDRDALEPIGVIADIRASADAGPTRIVGFVRHTNVARIAEARAAGADLVLARSAFFPALGDMLSAVSAS